MPAGRCTIVHLRDVVMTASGVLTQVATGHIGGMSAKDIAMLVVFVPCIPSLISLSRVPLYGHTMTSALGVETSRLCACKYHHACTRTPLVRSVGVSGVGLRTYICQPN